MNTTEISWGEDTLDSRDIIARYEELNETHQSLKDEILCLQQEIDELADEDLDTEDLYALDHLNDKLDSAYIALSEFEISDEFDELEAIREVISIGEDSPDWTYGETLIHEDYFTEYIKQIINDSYDLPKELESGTWPWNHMVMDWEAAAESAKQDYFEIEVEGNTYYIRS